MKRTIPFYSLEDYQIESKRPRLLDEIGQFCIVGKPIPFGPVYPTIESSFPGSVLPIIKPLCFDFRLSDLLHPLHNMEGRNYARVLKNDSLSLVSVMVKLDFSASSGHGFKVTPSFEVNHDDDERGDDVDLAYYLPSGIREPKDGCLGMVFPPRLFFGFPWEHSSPDFDNRVLVGSGDAFGECYSGVLVDEENPWHHQFRVTSAELLALCSDFNYRTSVASIRLSSFEWDTDPRCRVFDSLMGSDPRYVLLVLWSGYIPLLPELKWMIYKIIFRHRFVQVSGTVSFELCLRRNQLQK
jgi:hypothetical protein